MAAPVDYKATKAWKTAIQLGRPLTLLTEELPAQEDHGLIMTIQGLMVELPAAIALDVLTGKDSWTRRVVLLKLQSALEIVDTVYPALDTVGLKESITELIDHSESADFGTVETPVAPVTETPVEVDAHTDEAVTPAEPSPSDEAAAAGVTITDPSLLATPAPAPTAPAPEAAPAAVATPAVAPVTVAVTPDPATEPRV